MKDIIEYGVEHGFKTQSALGTATLEKGASGFSVKPLVAYRGAPIQGYTVTKYNIHNRAVTGAKTCKTEDEVKNYIKA